MRALSRNVLQAVPTVLVIVTLGFLLMQLAPGDAADVLAAEAGAATEESLAAIRKTHGLDRPLIEQLWTYYSHLGRFSLGQSARYNVPVADLILQRLPATVILMASAIAVALVLGLAMGTVMALSAGRWPDRVLSVVSLLFYSVPTFWIGLMLIILFSVRLGWLPPGGAGTVGVGLSGIAWLRDILPYLLLPASSLALYFMAIYARLTRAAVLEAGGQDHVRTARAKGLRPGRVIRRHVLRNALIPVTTLVGSHAAGILGGAVVVETVYTWPGLGRLAYEAVLAREYMVLLGILLVSAMAVIVINALVDILQALLDPRLEIR
ncbi:ABC transporter, membrane spanning protein (peptide) [Celeribacter indicus]|uniref:ABC transporter, membrane spanning protein (Peptide) n=1 Tax=Celeribacter indicus TaxID=1208324 RepID=A0A0B5DZ97_9RHOB|nr:ABC transporter, membrane spanning protein (peptide) [Celeribacter indicus]